MKDSRFLSKRGEILYHLVTCAIVIGVACFMVRCIRHQDFGYFYSDRLNYKFVYRDIPIMLLSSVFGIVPAVFSFVIVLFDASIFDLTESYSVSEFLLASLAAYLICRNGRYKNAWACIYSGVILTVFLGGVWYIIDLVASAEGLAAITAMDLVKNTTMVIPEVVTYVILMCLVTHFAADKVKRIFIMGVFYMREEDTNLNEIRERLNSKLSRQLSGIIFMEAAALGIAASVFAAELMPSVADKVLSNTTTDAVAFYDFRSQFDRYHNDGDPFAFDTDEGSEEEETTAQTEETASETKNSTTAEEGSTGLTEDARQTVRFVLNNTGIAFAFKMILMIFNVSIPFVILADNYMQRRVARPITVMAQTVKDFSGASHEEQTKKLLEMEKIRIRGNDEIAVLYDSIAQMASEINEFVNQTLRQQKLEEDLRVAQIASENKSNFLNNVSHELRTPINAVLGLDEMILRESHEEEIRNYAADIQNSGKTLLALVNDILDSSKLEAGKMEILPVEYELGSLINDAINMIAVKAREKGLKLDLHVDAHLPHILFGDEIRIKQIMVNILTNAVKYTEEGSVDFALGFEKQDDEHIYLECSIKDTGIGIKEEDMDKLFSRFERIDEGKNRTIEGTGLGMNIVRQLLALMDSSLSVESVYGAGSVFSFRLLQKVVSWDEMGDYEESYRRSLENATYHESFKAPDALILVTDDTPMNLTVIKALLKATQIRIETAESGFETLDKVKEKKYDVIFLDHRMPQMDGIETLKKMQELEGNLNADTPVISLTANAVSGAREVYMAAGFKDYLSKPIESQKLENMLMDYLPREKVIIEEAPSGDDENPQEQADASADEKLMAAIKEEGSLDVDEAVKNCGGEEVFLQVLKDYLGAIAQKSLDIERFLDEKDYTNYTVLVHALKSSSRLIGAKELSEDARYLEEQGNQATENDENARNEIDLKTPNVLELYRSYLRKFAFVIEEEDADADLPEIDQTQLAEAIEALKEFAAAFDFDSADAVMEMIGSYRLPEDIRPQMKEIKRYLAAVDQAALTEALERIEL